MRSDKQDKPLKSNAICAACGHIVTPETGLLRWFGVEEALATRYDRAGYFIVHTTACPQGEPRQRTVFYLSTATLLFHVEVENEAGQRAEIASGGYPKSDPDWARGRILSEFPNAVEV